MPTKPARRPDRPTNAYAPREGRPAAIVPGVLVAVLIGWAALGGYFARNPVVVFPASGSNDTAALYLSGDAGLHFGMSPTITRALASHGLPVIAINSPTIFRTYQTRREIGSIVARAVRDALARTRAAKLILVAQSYGADVLQTGLAGLPGDLRPRVVSLILVVPGREVFFRSDPSGLLYYTKPDGDGADTARMLRWLPVTCIYGQRETDSLYPVLDQANIRRIAMPGDHFLNHDPNAVVAQILAAVERTAPNAVHSVVEH